MEDEELAQVRNELEKVREEYRSFLYTVSHDLNAPIRHISSFSEIIVARNSDSFDEKTKEYFGFITRAGNDLAAMLAGLLKLSRLNTQQSAFETVNTGKVISDILESGLYQEIETKKAIINFGDLPVVSGDPGQISLLFLNLLSNALKFVPEGVSPIVSVATSETEQHWKFTVSDNGIGIEDKHCDTVFDVFKKAVEPGQYERSGVGLTMAKKIVERHGGTISIAPGETSGDAVTLQLAKSLQSAN